MTRHLIESGRVGKRTTLETATPLGAGATFTGPWHDSQYDGAVFVYVSCLKDVAGATMHVQETDDPSSAVMTNDVSSNGPGGANAIGRVWGSIKARYWRVTYTNGAAAQRTFELFATAHCVQPLLNSSDLGNTQNPLVYIVNDFAGTTVADNQVSSQALANASGVNNNYPLVVGNFMYGGAFSGTPDAARQGWSKARTPTVMRSIQATAAGSIAIWTPGANNKFRLLRYLIGVTANASLAAAGVLTVKLLDAAADIAQNVDIWLPAAAAGAKPSDNFYLPWVDLGTFGVLSAAANNILNVNLSAALTAGNVRVIATGTEE